MQLPPSEIGPEEARDTAEQVLSGRAYVEAARPPTLQERLFDWIGELFFDVFDAVATSGGRGFMSGLVLGSFLVMIIFLLYRLLRNLGPMPAKAAKVSPVIDVLDGMSAAEWLAAAAEAEAAGDWRTAVRCRHRSLVATLIRKGVVAARPGLTAGEIDRIVAENRPQVADPMREATWLFKDTWYGWVEATPESSARFATLADQVLSAELVSA